MRYKRRQKEQQRSKPQKSLRRHKRRQKMLRNEQNWNARRQKKEKTPLVSPHSRGCDRDIAAMMCAVAHRYQCDHNNPDIKAALARALRTTPLPVLRGLSRGPCRGPNQPGPRVASRSSEGKKNGFFRVATHLTLGARMPPFRFPLTQAPGEESGRGGAQRKEAKANRCF